MVRRDDACDDRVAARKCFTLDDASPAFDPDCRGTLAPVEKQPRRLVWGLPQAPSRRPLRDAALVYAAFAVVLVVIGVATGGSLVRSVAIAAAAYCLAVGWTAWRRRR
jgi:hypothetical protein